MRELMKNLGLIVATAIVVTAATVVAQFNVSNYMEQGGSRTVIGGSLDVVSGGDLDIESGGSLKIAGTAVSATAAQLNILSNVALTAGADPGATCTAGEIFIDTDETVDTNCTTTADNSLCLCTAANTWTALENN